MSLLGLGPAFAQAPATPRAPRVIVIGLDGLSIDGVLTAHTPRIHELMARGAWTLEARGVMPTLSSPNWESVIGGAPPEQHGITSNGYLRRLVEFEPACQDAEGKFPTIFGLLRDQQPLSRIAIFHEWSGFARLVEQRGPDVLRHESSGERVVTAAMEYWQANHPALLFLHLDGADHAGHETGWLSRSYYQAVAELDGYVGAILDVVTREEAWDSTYVLVTSDHGGTRHGHGHNSLAEIQIPWILAGPAIVPGRIAAPVNTYDTAVTLASIFGLEVPPCWTGRPVTSAFETAAVQFAVRSLPQTCSPTMVTGAALRIANRADASH